MKRLFGGPGPARIGDRQAPVSGANFLLQSQSAARMMHEIRDRLLAEGYVQVDDSFYTTTKETTMIVLPDVCITENFVMPPWQQSSFPLLAIARQYDLDYGDVCIAADGFIKTNVDPSWTMKEFEIQADERLIRHDLWEAEIGPAICEVALRMPRAGAH
jgi:hypothetical protein